MKSTGVDKFILASVCFFNVALSFALEVEGVQIPEKITQNATQLNLNGTAVRTVTLFGIRVYVMALYLEQPTADPAAIIQSDQEKRIVMHFLRSVDAGRLREGWREGFANNTSDGNALAERLALLNEAMREVEAGDTLIFEFSGDSVSVVLDTEEVIVVDGKDFQRALLRVWLGPKPPGEELKRRLLAGGVADS